MASAPGTAN